MSVNWPEQILDEATIAVADVVGTVSSSRGYAKAAVVAAVRAMAERPDKWWHQEELDNLADDIEVMA